MPEIRKKITTNSVFYRILRPVLRIWLEKQFNLKAEIPDEVRALKPPFLILPNHQGFWDPFMAAVYIRYPVYYIASDAIFRSGFFKFILQMLGAIPKTKAQSDIDALKHIVDIKRRGQIIGIFPEGRRTWDGVTLPLVYSTSKLIRMLQIPVVTVVFKGGFFSQPRWGFHIQKGEVVMDYKLLFSGSDVKSMKIEDIHRKLAGALYFDETEYQKKQGIRFRGKKAAEYIEQVLFACPSCRSIGDLRSSGNSLKCESCGYEVKFNSVRMFDSIKGDLVFDNIRDWNRWQLEYLAEYIDANRSGGEAYLEDSNLVVYTGYKSRKPALFATGSLLLKKEQLVIRNDSGEDVLTVPLEEISGLNIQNKEHLEFYYKGRLYAIWCSSKRFSAYKWLNALEYLLKDKAPSFQAG